MTKDANENLPLDTGLSLPDEFLTSFISGCLVTLARVLSFVC